MTEISLKDFAGIISVNWKRLYLSAYRPRVDPYEEMQIPKRGRSRGFRIIAKPNGNLFSLQKAIATWLKTKYRPRNIVHGFVSKRSSKTNAKVHLGKKFTIRVDLSDFFGSIHFGRVKGVLLSEPFLLSNSAANCIATICCYKGCLPQGSPASPIIANIICRGLDLALVAYARRNRVTITRYADDIAISTDDEYRFKRIRNSLRGETKNELNELIERHGFKLNHSKTMFMKRGFRQIVTGIVISDSKMNVPRKFIRSTRRVLRAIEKFEGPPTIDEMNSIASMTRKCAGMIEYIGSIRGKNDYIFLALVERIRKISDLYFKNVNLTLLSEMRRRYSTRVMVIEGMIMGCNDFSVVQGTGFLIGSSTLVTCAHCVVDAKGNKISDLKAYFQGNEGNKYSIAINKCGNQGAIDLAECTVEGLDSSTFFEVEDLSINGINVSDQIEVVGYPNFGSADSLAILKGQVVQKRVSFGTDVLSIQALIVKGNSGGPVIRKEKVIAVACKDFFLSEGIPMAISIDQLAKIPEFPTNAT